MTFELEISAQFLYNTLSFPARTKHLILRALVNQAQFVEKLVKHLPVQSNNRKLEKGVNSQQYVQSR